ncbi:hypothetical protein P0136_01635 [Lentisphaerota bacterium ZTH]|nr:hypothetical protein JYG24_07225 [Lentisphaerota bacterium]WET06714.1 hypothetical protein P0136_01635 [Lentisphaerota bacterium ZTH]
MKNVHEQESGIALIAVLCMILTASLLVASAVTLSQYSALETVTFCSYGSSFYTAESAANRARWMIMIDKKRFTNRALGVADSAVNGRWMADSMPHRMLINGIPVEVSVEDAASGINLVGNKPSQEMRGFMQKYFMDSTGRDAFTAICDQLDLYCDPNSLVRSGGGIQQDYMQRGLFNMPRMAPMQFREEAYYIPGIARRYPPDSIGRLRIFNVLPFGFMRRIMSRPNLFSAPLSMIKDRCQLSTEETAQLANGLRLWRINRIPLKNSIDGMLMGKLLGQFSDRESGFFSIIVKTASAKSPGTTLNCTFCPDSTKPPLTEYYNYTFY